MSTMLRGFIFAAGVMHPCIGRRTSFAQGVDGPASMMKYRVRSGVYPMQMDVARKSFARNATGTSDTYLQGRCLPPRIRVIV